MTTRPDKNSIVQRLCHTHGEAYREVKSRSGDKVQKLHNTCICPRCNKTLFSQKGSGPGNVIEHLKKCLTVNKTMEELHECYYANIKKNGKESGITSFFSVANNTENKALYDWIELIVMNSLPVDSPENKLFRRVFKHSYHFSANRIKKIILQMVEICEYRKRNEGRREGKYSS